MSGFAGVTSMLLRVTWPSLSPIVITALASVIVPLPAAVRSNVKVSGLSMAGQSRISTRTTVVVIPRREFERPCDADVVVGAAVGGNGGHVMSRVVDRHRVLPRSRKAHHQIDEAVPLAHRDIERSGDSGQRDRGSIARADRDRPRAPGDRGASRVAETEREALRRFVGAVVGDGDDDCLGRLPGANEACRRRLCSRSPRLRSRLQSRSRP